MKLVHAADLHLDSALHGLTRYESAPADEIRGATRRAFSNLVGLCLEERAGLLVISGDLFDGDWRDVSTGLFFAKELNKLCQAGVRVAWIRGNHDAVSQIRKSVRLPEPVIELSHERAETRVLEDLGVAVHGRSFGRRDVTEDLAATYPERVAGALNVGLLHTALEGRTGHDRYAPTRVETLVNRGYEYWALGHVHQREVVHREPYLVFPGNLQGRHARELGEKGATLVTYEGDRISAVEHRSLDVVRWAELSVPLASAQTLDDVLSAAHQELTRAADAAQSRLLAFRVKLSGPTRLDASLRASRDKLREELCSLSYGVSAGAWLEKVVIATEPLERELPLGDDALAEIERALAELVAESGTEGLSELLGDLSRRLPAEVLELVPELRAAGGALAEELAVDVRSLLRERLAAGQQA
ncbi:MAG: metallophosphoesterase [Polyangiaceae bacterium]|jgi:DNA repair exonuclease SbcCD nuclease subunit|nr:metallophosphoesterase [Polyangiaceae bacterium]